MLRRLRNPRLLAFLVGVALYVPSLWAGFFGDDLVHLSILDGRMPPEFQARPWDLFRFADGDVASTSALVSKGYFPWWTDPRLRVSFFRPLTSFTHWLDYELWGYQAVGYHLTNLVLWALVLAAAWAVLRRMCPSPRSATLAFWIYAVADARALPVVWPANRNALIAAALGFAALALWDGYRRGEGRWKSWAAFAVFAVAIFAGEAALGALMLLVGYEALGLPDAKPLDLRRAAAAAPFGFIAVVYAAMYKLLGYGAAHSATYIDPVTTPVDWLAAAVARVPTLLAGVLWAWPIDLWITGESEQRWLLAGGIALTIASVWFFRGVVKRHRVVAAFALGGFASLLPVASTFPSNRLLLIPGIAGALILGTYLDETLPLRAQPWLDRLAAGILWLRTVLLAPFIALALVVTLSSSMREVRDAILRSPWPADVSTRAVYLLDSPQWSSANYIAPYLGFAGRPSPRAVYVLNLSAYPKTLSRLSERTLELEVDCGAFHTDVFEQVMRSEPLAVGDSIDVGAFKATIAAANRHGPTRIRFELAPWKGPDPWFVRWEKDRYIHVELPPVGGSLHIDGVGLGVGDFHGSAPACRSD